MRKRLKASIEAIRACPCADTSSLEYKVKAAVSEYLVAVEKVTPETKAAVMSLCKKIFIKTLIEDIPQVKVEKQEDGSMLIYIPKTVLGTMSFTEKEGANNESNS